MKHPNAFYIGDRLLADDNHWVTVRAFVRPAGGRQLVRVEYPDGSVRNRGFESLSRPRPIDDPDEAHAQAARVKAFVLNEHERQGIRNVYEGCLYSPTLGRRYGSPNG